MAVYKKTYRPYDGALTPGWTRFLVIPRYAFEEMRSSRFLTIFFLASFIYPLICALIIYVQHNASALNLLGVQDAEPADLHQRHLLPATSWAGRACWRCSWRPSSARARSRRTWRNNALSLYLARPFSRAEYVLGKMWILVVLMSLMTWVPGLLLFLLQAYLEGAGPGCTTTASIAVGAVLRRPGSGFWCSRCWRWRSRRG